MPYDLFISYSRLDNEKNRVTQLLNRIRTDFAPLAKRELAPFLDEQEIVGRQDWRQRILQGLRESRLLLACFSPAYLKSEYCEWEFVEYLKYEIGHRHGFNGIAPIYFVEVPGWDSKDFEHQCAAWVTELRRRQHFDLRPWHDQGEKALREAAVLERMGALNRQIVQTITRGERADKSLGNVDAHNPHFIGRTANLRMLRDNFVTPGQIGVVTAVNGVGGLGKTALAIEYAHSFADQYGGGRWQVRCAGKDDLRLALAELATPIGFEFTDGETKNADLQFERTRRELKKLADARAPHRCLLLLDNVDRPGLLHPTQVARLNGGDWLHVLATTRLGENELHDAHRDRSFLAIDELPPDDAFALLESYQPSGGFRSEVDCAAAREIVRVLGCFTLAVESAAVYLGQFADDVTCAGFLARLKKEGLEGLDTAASQSSGGVLHGEKRLRATLQPTLERLGAAERLTLEFAAVLPPDQIPLPWLRALVARTFPEMERDAEPGYPDPWKNVLRLLFGLRLLQTTDVLDADGQPRVVRTHVVIQHVILDGCPAHQRAERQHAAFQLVEQRNLLLNQTTSWVGVRWELEPLTALAVMWADTGLLAAPWLLSETAGKWWKLAEWSRAEVLSRRALGIIERTREPDDPEIALYLGNRAALLRSMSQYEEAELLTRRALTMNENHYGPEHPKVTGDLSFLALLLLATNRAAQAELLMRRVLTNVARTNGPDHPNFARELTLFAGLLYESNRLVEAAELMRQALTIQEGHLGPDHPHMATYLMNLGSVLCSINQSAEAERLMRRALAIDERTFGPQHPDVARDLGALGQVLQDTNREAEAEQFMRRALAIAEKRFEPEDPTISVYLNNLAQLLQAKNHLGEAERLLQRSLAIDEKALGLDHPKVAIRLNNLAMLLQATRRLNEAEPLMRRQLEILLKFTQSTGQTHTHLGPGIENYGALLEAMGWSNDQVRSHLQAIYRHFNVELAYDASKDRLVAIRKI